MRLIIHSYVFIFQYLNHIHHVVHWKKNIQYLNKASSVEASLTTYQSIVLIDISTKMTSVRLQCQALFVMIFDITHYQEYCCTEIKQDPLENSYFHQCPTSSTLLMSAIKKILSEFLDPDSDPLSHLLIFPENFIKIPPQLF